MAWNEAVTLNNFKDLTALHVHVGAGKIGLGLTLPALVESGRPFAVLQRPSATWDYCLANGRALIRVNGQEIVELTVVSTLRDVESAFASEVCPNLLVLSVELPVVCA